jgi:pilus assembly protein Flp/PilA
LVAERLAGGNFQRPPGHDNNSGAERHLMKALKQFAVNFLAKEDGPTAVEYAVMLALIIVVCIAAITTLGQNANSTFTTVGNTIGGAS